MRTVLIALALILITPAAPGPAQAAAPRLQRAKHTVPPKRRLKRPACSDRRDNDHDGLTDYPKDRGCRSRTDRRERDPRRPTPTPSISPSAPPDSGAPLPDLGIGASFHGRRFFPVDNPWNTDISNASVDPNSRNLIAGVGLDTGLHPDFGTFWEGAPIGIPYAVVPGDQRRIPVSFYYPDESDPGPYPVPPDAPIEGGSGASGDRHVLIVDRDNWHLYELYDAWPQRGGSSWQAGSGAFFNLNSNTLRPDGWTSADAAGLPILPGLVRYDEVYERGEINHALRFTVSRSRRAYVHPATHYASSNTDPNLPPMGMRVRLKASVEISSFPQPVRVVLAALKKYGMFVADNGANWYITGAHDPRWNDEELSAIRAIKGRDFEVVEMGRIITD